MSDKIPEQHIMAIKVKLVRPLSLINHGLLLYFSLVLDISSKTQSDDKKLSRNKHISSSKTRQRVKHCFHSIEFLKSLTFIKYSKQTLLSRNLNVDQRQSRLVTIRNRITANRISSTIGVGVSCRMRPVDVTSQCPNSEDPIVSVDADDIHQILFIDALTLIAI